jgi:hypothetical protein
MARQSQKMAFGGMMTAVAVVIMSLGSLIPVNTYVCPVLCILITRLVMGRCGRQTAWCYYMAAALLSLLLAPDREAALVYLFLGYYPLIRHRFAGIRPHWLSQGAKLLFFTASGALVYGLLTAVMGVEAVLGEYTGPGLWLLAVTVILWDVMLLMVDRLLGRPLRRRK